MKIAAEMESATTAAEPGSSRPRRWLVRVVYGAATFGFVVEDGIVTSAAPLAREWVGKTGRQAVDHYRWRDATVTWEADPSDVDETFLVTA